MRWGQGSLQEIDHLPFVSPLVKSAATAKEPAQIAGLTAAALDPALDAAERRRRSSTTRSTSSSARAELGDRPPPGGRRRAAAPKGLMERAAALLARGRAPGDHGRQRPLLGPRGGGAAGAGGGAAASPCSSMVSGAAACPADHELVFSRARGVGLKGADVALVDRRADRLPARLRRQLRRGDEDRPARRRAERAERQPRRRSLPSWSATSPARLAAIRARQRRAGLARALARVSCARSRTSGVQPSARSWRRSALAAAPGARLRASWARCSTATRSSSATAATSSPTPGASSTPTSPAAGSTRARSVASALGPARRSAPRSPIPTARSACCSATAPSASPGWSSTRWRVTASDVVGVMGNNGIWALEHHPMEFLYGYSVAAELRPETRYDQMVEALGCDGVLVREPGELRPALERAFESGGRRWSTCSPTRGRLPAQIEPGLRVCRRAPPALRRGLRSSRGRRGAEPRRAGCRALRPQFRSRSKRPSPRKAAPCPRRSSVRGPGADRHLPALCFVHAREAGEQSLHGTARQLVAVDLRRVVGVELLVDRRCGGRRSRHRDAALHGCSDLRRQTGLKDLAHVACDCLQLGRERRVGRDVALAHPHNACLQRGVERRCVVVADDELGGAAADVDHHARLIAGRRPLVAPRNVSCASSSPVRTFASSPRERTRSLNCGPLTASRTAEVSTARLRSQPALDLLAVSREHVERAVGGLVGELALRIYAVP